MRIDHRPLAHPIATDAVPSVNMPTFHSICPDDILVHCREHILHVASVEPIVEEFEQFSFGGHQNLPSIRHSVYPRLTFRCKGRKGRRIFPRGEKESCPLTQSRLIPHGTSGISQTNAHLRSLCGTRPSRHAQQPRI